jgi:hypothetical protein
LVDTSVELALLLVSASLIAAGISISIATRRKKSNTSSVANVFQDEFESGTETPQEQGGVPNIPDTREINDRAPSTSIENDFSQEPVESTPSMPVSAVESFQASREEQLAENPPASPVFEQAETESIHDHLTNNDLETKASEAPEHANTIESSIISPPEPKEPVSENPQSQESFSPTNTSFALPTDSVAIQNISPTPFPVGVQNATSNSLDITGYNNAPSAYCVKCKSKKLIKEPSAVTMKNGRSAISGYCVDCGTKVFRIGKFISPSG